MTVAPLREKALVLYKTSPALVLKPGDKIEIALGSGETVRVRPKDIELIHPGPCESLGGLGRLEGDTSDAWELLQGQTSTLKELAELVYGAYTPATAWSAWLVVAEGLYFQGTPAGVQARPPGEVEAERGTREKAAAEARAWGEFLERAKQGKAMAEDRRFTADVEAVALGKSQKSRLMRELGTQVTAENAHALLLRLGHWTPSENPYPRRYDMPLTAPRVELPPIAEEQRRDLTHLEAYAIDDEGNQDPDDALSYDGQRIWIHVADVAALVAPDSPADVEARGVGANLYLPERIVPMLPPEATLALGLGLQPISPALSFGLVIGPDGGIEDIEITPSRVKVTRLTYEEADTRLSEGIFPQLLDITGRFKARRRRLNPVTIDYPEVKIRVVDGRVVIRPLVRLRSRELVTEAMLMAGEAAARFALKHHIAFPFTTQPAPEGGDAPQDLAAMFAFRKKLKPSVNKASAEPHFGLGLEAYARATSPLRRYLDLVVHQQLRGFLTGGRQLGVAEMLERVGAAEAVLGSVKRVERLSNLHWTLVYLLQNPDWTGKGIVLDRQKQQAVVVIPALGMETRVYAPGNAALNSELELRSPKVDLAFLSAHFQVR